MINELITQANDLLKNKGFEYAFCGGFGIDLFLGYASRKHSDIDISAYWSDRNIIILYMQSLGYEVYEMLGGGKAHHITNIDNQYCEKRNIFCCTKDCEIIDLTETNEQDICYINFQHIGQTELNFIEFLFNKKTEKNFIYARNSQVKQGLDNAILYNGDIPYLSPEICLLYKSTDTEREGYQSDFELALSKMNDVQKQWFFNALHIMFSEGHKWRL